MIIIMDGGQVAAVGTHDELLQNSNIYREVYESQRKGGDE
jgi:ATP-binding cassette subfamily B protein